MWKRSTTRSTRSAMTYSPRGALRARCVASVGTGTAPTRPNAAVAMVAFARQATGAARSRKRQMSCGCARVSAWATDAHQQAANRGLKCGAQCDEKRHAQRRDIELPARRAQPEVDAEGAQRRGRQRRPPADPRSGQHNARRRIQRHRIAAGMARRRAIQPAQRRPAPGQADRGR